MDIKKYIYGHCVHPVRVRVFDTYSNSYVVKELPCGKCLHCRITHVNEWVTRLYAQAKYSAYVYYITLDYSPFSYEKDSFPDGFPNKLAVDTAAVWHNININKRFGMQPLLLRKSHLQQFFKRFRKNTGLKIQYFACGEYGTHANGTGFGRPHFHVIIFSDSPITEQMFLNAWTLDGYVIGSIKYFDITDQAKGLKSDNNLLNAKFVFKYVCKYLQKQDFDFEKLATIDFHRAYFESMQKVFTNECTLFEPMEQIKDRSILQQNWSKYCLEFSPFVVCSKRPSLGLAYFNDNKERFKNSDFRLFGLSKECTAFPHYYVRKTKESLCTISSIGDVSFKPTSSSSIGWTLSLLREIRDSRLDISIGCDAAPSRWFTRKDPTSGNVALFRYDDDTDSIPLSKLHMYDNDTKVFYQFNGYCYTTWQKVKKLGYVRLCDLSIDDVLNYVSPKFDSYFNCYVVPMHNIQVLREKDLFDCIDVLYDGQSFEDKYNSFLEYVDNAYNAEIHHLHDKSLYIHNSKNIY